MSEVDDEVLIMAKDLELDETISTSDCPDCMGGFQKDRAFTITRVDQGYVYNCFRASCGLCGFVPTKRAPATSRIPFVTQNNTSRRTPSQRVMRPLNSTQNFKPKYYVDGVIALTNEQKEFLEDRYSMSRAEIDSTKVRYNPMRGTYVYPIRSSTGERVGVVDRSYTGQRKPKSLTYREIDRPLLHFPLQYSAVRKGPTYLVEDQMSATKVSRYANCVALLGCNLTDAGATVLQRVTNKIIFALDGDATKAALRLRNEYAGMFKHVAVIQLKRDPKDCDDETLRIVFGQKD